MTYKGILNELIKNLDIKKAWCARQLGISRNAVGFSLDEGRGMTMENFLRFTTLLGARVIVEWTDPRNGAIKYRWKVDPR